jgi:DNA-binding Lrp family transcriptional regulator
MQDLDSDILKLILRDGKLTYEEIGEWLGRSPSTIRDRIKKMEEDRTILGYAAIVDEGRVGITTDALISADLPHESSSGAMTSLFSLENVTEIMHLTGERRILLRVKARSNEELLDILDKRIRPLGFENIEVSLVLEPVVRFPGL